MAVHHLLHMACQHVSVTGGGHMGHGGVEVLSTCVCEFPGPSFELPVGGDLCADMSVSIVCGYVSKLFVDAFVCWFSSVCDPVE